METTANDAVVTVRGLRKSYDGRVVVDDVDLDVHAGEVVGLIGGNGAGKTTTVECIQGLRRPDAGVIRVLGCDPTRDTDRLRTMLGSQLQDSAVPDRMRIGEAITLFAGPDARDGGELLERFGLARRTRSPFAGMSGGERQRLFLVLALLNRPRLVILDELTQGLDPAARREVWRSVAQLRDEGTTVLLVTHELDEAEELCGRVVAMRDGRVLDAGRPAELVDRHAPWARLRFSWDAATAADLAADLGRLACVRRAEAVHGLVEVEGRREAVAYVGAELVRHGHVPTDLHVELPDLEDALLHLLDTPPTNPANPAKIGA